MHPSAARVKKLTKLTVPALAVLLLVGGCQREEQPPANSSQAKSTASTGDYTSFAGPGRDRLCQFGPTAAAGVISYGGSDTSCLARGRLEADAFVPSGDEQCRMPVTRDGGDRVTFGALPPACAYYCGPGASLEGKTFVRMAKPEPVMDIAGDALC